VLDFDVDNENHMQVLPPTLFVRLRQERAADRIGRKLYSTHRDRTDEEAIIYLNMQQERLKTDRKTVDGVDNRMSYIPLGNSYLANPRLVVEALYHHAVRTLFSSLSVLQQSCICLCCYPT
jgi:hypothetical protein